MGVFVKGMYLPPNCYFCPMTNDGFYLCKANNPHKQLEDDCEERRPNWCPLIEVSEPHGRLISADELIEFIENRYEITWKDDYEGGIKDACVDILEKISVMPTAIQASEDEL